MTNTINAQNILKVADAIEGKSIPGLGFFMDYLTYSGSSAAHLDMIGTPNCGTVACIAGWASHIMGQADRPSFSGAQEFFGITEVQREELFYARNHPLTEDDGEGWVHAPLDQISGEQAVRTLRHLAATGVVDWTV